MKSRIPTLFRWGAIALMVGTLGACGSSNDSTPAGGGGVTPPPPPAAIVTPPTAEAVAAAAAASSETCSLCHAGSTPLARSGPGHQADYDQLYQNGVIKVTSMNLTSDGTTTTLVFSMTEDKAGTGATAFDCTKAENINAAYNTYDTTARDFTYASGFNFSLKPTTAADVAAALAKDPTSTLTANGTISNAAGTCTYVKTHSGTGNLAVAAAIAAGQDGIAVVYGADGILETNGPRHTNKAKYPWAGVWRQGPNMAGAAPYVSAANVTGCENCHTVPFNKHMYIPGTVDDLTPGAAGTTQQFYVCKACHLDQGSGGHEFWQLLQDAKNADPATAEGAALRARAVAVNGGDAVSAPEKTKYAYKKNLMNDVHMSHAMEFAYPQSMRNCVTCHSGKLGETAANDIFNKANFAAETCISCHGVDGITAKMKAASYNHATFVTDTATLRAATCSVCHDGSAAPKFSKVHTGGYDPKIYASDGTRYSTSFTFASPTITYDATTNVLNAKFSATGTVGSLTASSIVPTVIVGPYGYNTKDFIVAPHGRDADGNRLLEYKFGGTNPRFTEVATGTAGSWEVNVDMSAWKDMIADGTIKRVELAVLPELKDASGTVLGLDAPSVTFNLANNALEPTFTTGDLINVQTVGQGGGTATKGCNTCHDQLATTFHSGIRGGNIVVCRLCHVKSSGGSHLELQSRSIDSYVHAIHSFQVFDPGDIDFTDGFEAMEYAHHTESWFPRFGLGNGTTDCESCHKAGTYGTPDQSKSLPALLSKTDTLNGTTTVGAFPSYVTGPGANACGACHRAMKIVEKDGGGLTTLFQHWKGQGYLIEDVDTLWDATVAKVMATFK